MDRRPRLGCRFFRTRSGTEPVREWLKQLKEINREAAKVIGRDLARVQWRWPVSRPLVAFLGDGLYEVRTTAAKAEYRVIFTVVQGELLLLHAFKKKSQKIPKADRELARRRKHEGER